MSHAPGIRLKPLVSLGREPCHCWSWIGSIDEGCYGRVTQTESCRQGVTASLMPADIMEIRRARKNRTPNMRQHLADRYGVAPSTISDIWGRKSWRKPKPFYGAKKNAPKESVA